MLQTIPVSKGQVTAAKIIDLEGENEEEEGRRRGRRGEKGLLDTEKVSTWQESKVINSHPFKKGMHSPARSSLPLACFTHLLSSCPCKPVGLQPGVDRPVFPRVGKRYLFTV